MTDSTGTVVWAADYKPFGETVNISGSITNNLRFPGQYRDAETGTLYNYFRDYDPAVGRYNAKDPSGLAGGINLYAYVMNNPINWIDFFGLECSCSASGIVRAARSHEGESGWGKPGWSGGFGWVTEFKCNRFVNKAVTEGKSTPPLVNGRPAQAGELADKNQEIPNWPVVDGPPRNGDIVAIGHAGPGYTGHSGIVVGQKQTASANSQTRTVTINDWGFREGQEPTVRRCSCEE